MKRLSLVLAAALAGCAVDAGVASDECTFGTDTNRAGFCESAREIEARTERDAKGLHIKMKGDPGRSSSWAKALIARESTCCPHLKFRYEQTEELNVLHVSADDDPGGDIDRIHRLLQQK